MSDLISKTKVLEIIEECKKSGLGYETLKREIRNIGNQTIDLNSLFKPVDEKTPINEDIPF